MNSLDTKVRIQRFLSKFAKKDSCWEWHGAKVGQGYGAVTVAGQTLLAHRVSYEFYVGPIPEGLQIDHLCRNRACVNPDHLEAVLQKANLLRGESFSAKNARKTHCTKGHEFTSENTYRYQRKDGSWRRDCRICRAAARRRSKEG